MTQRGLYCALLLVVWLGLDFQGIFTSVLGTYFYFGGKGTPFGIPRMLIASLLTIAGPLVYWLWFVRRGVRRELALLLGLQAAAYLLCCFVRQSDVFAWTTVFGRLVSGATIVAVLRRLSWFDRYEWPVLAIVQGFLIYLWARLLNDGLPVIVHPTVLGVGMLGVVLGGALGGAREPAPETRDRPARGEQLSALGFVVLLDLGLALLVNLNLWSARAPDVHAYSYLLSFGVGSAAALLHAWFARGRLSVLVGASVGMAFGVSVVLWANYGAGLGMAAHACGCYGLTLFCATFVRRLWNARTLPILGLQAGALLGLVVFGLFLNRPDPIVFASAFVVGAALMVAGGRRRPVDAPGASPLPGRQAGVAVAALLLAVLPAVWLPANERDTGGDDPDELTVLTTNARYGWTDDFRFDPDPYVAWLQENPATIVGMQEVNKGNFYGGFADVFEYYRKRVQATAIYGDANFGFGNALFTQLEVIDSKVLPYETNSMIRRSTLWSLVRWRGREIEVFVTHVSHGKGANPTRRAQVRELVARLAEAKRPWILMGDMNAHPEDPEIQDYKTVAHPLFGERDDLFAEKTYPAATPTQRLDYIFFSKEFELIEQSVLDPRGATDHRAIRSRLRLR